MITLTHTAALPVRPSGSVSLIELARGGYRRLRVALRPRKKADTIFAGPVRRERPEVVYMRFYA